MNPGIVFGLGFIAAPSVALATYAIARARRAEDPSGWAVVMFILTLIAAVGAAMIATNATPCGWSSYDTSHHQWQGNTCVDTKAVQR